MMVIEAVQMKVPYNERAKSGLLAPIACPTNAQDA